MSERATRPTPPGTWPLLVSGAQSLLLVPAYFLGIVVPPWLAIVGAFLFTLVAIGALLWSYATYLRREKPRDRGVPLAGIPLGVIAVVVSALVLVPAALAR